MGIDELLHPTAYVNVITHPYPYPDAGLAILCALNILCPLKGHCKPIVSPPPPPPPNCSVR